MTDPAERVALAAYVRDLFAPEDELLRELREAIAGVELPEIYISPDEGRLLQVLLCAVDARRVVEIGTLGGYSAIWMARALPADGRLITIERKPAAADLARRFIERAGLADRVEVRLGDARQVLPKIAASGPFDLVFIDADKVSYPFYLDWSLEHVRPGGLILADNAYWEGKVLDADSEDPDTVGIREFNRQAATDPRLRSIVVPTRDGVAISVRVRE